jgi:alpha-N-arabinofuranosidase
MVCLGIRPQGGRFHHLGRETFLTPVKWTGDGWPVVNNDGTIELTMPAPQLTQKTWEKISAKDDFNNVELGLAWNFLRNPYEEDFSLTERPGYLRLNGSAVTLNDQDSPAFVGRRQTDFNCIASILLEFDPNSENEEAGFVVRQNDKHHYEIGVTVRQGKRRVFFRKVLKGKTIEPIKYVDIQSGPVTLSVKASPSSYEFFCTSSTGAQESLGTALMKDLSVEEIGFEDGMCFTGVYFGLYATGNGRKCTTPADFDWFEYLSTEESL